MAPRARAHNVDGTFTADDPSTPNVNEAYKQEKHMAKQPEAPKVEKKEITPEAPAAPAVAKEAPRKPGYYVLPKCAVTTLKGVKGPGDLITVDMIAGKESNLESLVVAKKLEKVEKA